MQESQIKGQSGSDAGGASTRFQFQIFLQLVIHGGEPKIFRENSHCVAHVRIFMHMWQYPSFSLLEPAFATEPNHTQPYPLCFTIQHNVNNLCQDVRTVLSVFLVDSKCRILV